jgi:hypothetical protein
VKNRDERNPGISASPTEPSGQPPRRPPCSVSVPRVLQQNRSRPVSLVGQLLQRTGKNLRRLLPTPVHHRQICVDALDLRPPAMDKHGFHFLIRLFYQPTGKDLCVVRYTTHNRRKLRSDMNEENSTCQSPTGVSVVFSWPPVPKKALTSTGTRVSLGERL